MHTMPVIGVVSFLSNYRGTAEGGNTIKPVTDV